MRHCKKKVEDESEKEKGDQWTKVQKQVSTKQTNKSRVKGDSIGSNAHISDQPQVEGIATSSRVEAPSNPFEILITLEDPTIYAKDRDQQPLSTVIEEVNA